MYYITEILELIEPIAVISTSAVAVFGVISWRKEAKFNRKYEIAEEVLASLYEVQHAIKSIRYPFGTQEEGKSRKPNEDETPRETKIYDQTYVVRERYQQKIECFKNLFSLKFRFIAIFGKEYEKYFNIIFATINQIITASDINAYIYVHPEDFDKKERSEILMRNSKILYEDIRTGEIDEIESEIKNAVEKMENVCRKIIGK